MTDPALFLSLPELPALLARHGLLVIALLTLAGMGAAAAVGGFLAAAGIIDPVEAATAALAAALLSDAAAYAAGRAFKGRMAEILEPPAILRNPGPTGTGSAALLLRRLAPGAWRAAPVAAARAETGMGTFLLRAAPGCVLWSLAATLAGYAAGLAALSAMGGRIPVWGRLGGFLALILVAYPVVVFVLWHYGDKLLGSIGKNAKRGCVESNGSERPQGSGGNAK